MPPSVDELAERDSAVGAPVSVERRSGPRRTRAADERRPFGNACELALCLSSHASIVLARYEPHSGAVGHFLRSRGSVFSEMSAPENAVFDTESGALEPGHELSTRRSGGSSPGTAQRFRPRGLSRELRASYTGASERIRTSDLRLRRPSLYPAELRTQRPEWYRTILRA